MAEAEAAPARSRAALLLIVPTLAFLVVFLLLPYLNMVVMSMRQPSTRQVFAPGFTSDNYLNALLDPDFYYLRILWNTMTLGVMTTAICLLLGYPVAYHLARSRSRFKGMLYAFILSPLLVGVVVRCYGWIIILANNDGLINDSLRRLGLVKTLPAADVQQLRGQRRAGCTSSCRS